MERVLADVLRDQRDLSNKGGRGAKRSALNAATAVLSTSFNVNVTSNNVKNHIKLVLGALVSFSRVGIVD